jgi:tripartite motif-containing protein 71
MPKKNTNYRFCTTMNAFVLSGLFLLVILFCLESIINNNITLSLLYSVEKYLFVVGWGTLGISDGQFDKPHEISVDPSGNVYVADTGNNRIQKFSSNGTFIAKWGSKCSSSAVSSDIENIPCKNPSDGEFASPNGISVDPSGNVYVADTGNNRIQKFSSNGTFIAKWGTTCDLRLNVGCTNSGAQASSLLDEGDGQFNSPSSIAVNPSTGNVYVADTGNNRIQEFTSSGIFIAKWGFEGQPDGYFTEPSSVAVDPTSGNVYVADTGNNRIQEFTSSGIFIKRWGSSGSADGEFIGPTGVAVSTSSGNVYVADYGNNRIQVFKRDGTFITVWGSSGFGAYQFNGPKSIAVDPSSGEVYVTDIFNNRIQSFDLAPTFTSK